MSLTCDGHLSLCQQVGHSAVPALVDSLLLWSDIIDIEDDVTWVAHALDDTNVIAIVGEGVAILGPSNILEDGGGEGGGRMGEKGRRGEWKRSVEEEGEG